MLQRAPSLAVHHEQHVTEFRKLGYLQFYSFWFHRSWIKLIMEILNGALSLLSVV